MHESQHRARSETDILKAEPNVKKHARCRYQNSHYRIGLHFAADRRTDGLRRNFFRIRREIIYHRIFKLLSFRYRQSPRLKDHFIGSCHLLRLYVSVAGNRLNRRHDILIDLFNRHILIKGYVRGSTAHKFQTVVQSASAGRLIHAHHNESCCDNSQGNGEKYFSPG